MPDVTGAPSAAVGIPVLIVTSQFPVNGGARIDKFVGLLPQRGFNPIVVTARETTSALARELLRTRYPDTLETFEARSIGWTHFAERYQDRGPDARFYRLLAVLSFPERCVFVPDYMVRWVPHGILLARRLARSRNIPVVLTSSPPASTHLIGLALKRSLGIRWIADFRDLWTTKKLLYRPATPVHDWWTRRLERFIMRTADHIIANTDENRDQYVDRFNLVTDRVSVIPNGFDRDDLPAPGPRLSRHEFTIGYMGDLFKHGFPWKLFLQAVKKLADEVGRDKVRVVHCGFCAAEISAYLCEHQLQDLVIRHGLVPHADAMRTIAATDMRVALLYENEYSAGIVPAKLYNYLIMDGPILAIAPERGAVARILAETGMGSVVAPSAGIEQVHAALRQYFERWNRGERWLHPSEQCLAQYDRHRHADQLASILLRTPAHHTPAAVFTAAENRDARPGTDSGLTPCAELPERFPWGPPR